MTESRKTYAYFWVAGDVLPHDEISLLLGLKPTKYWNKGDPGKYIQEQKLARWVYESPLPKNEIFIDSHISALMDLLELKVNEVAKLSELYEVGIQCVGYYTEANPGFHMSKELINKVSTLGLDLDFDLYCLNEND